MEFRWNDWNIEHIAKHGIDPEEAELAVRAARHPFPRFHGEQKWIVWARGRGGRPIQVVYVLDDDDTKFVIHARPLTTNEKKRFRRGISS